MYILYKKCKFYRKNANFTGKSANFTEKGTVNKKVKCLCVAYTFVELKDRSNDFFSIYETQICRLEQDGAGEGLQP